VLPIFNLIPVPVKASDRGAFERIQNEEQTFLHYTQEYSVPGGETYEIEVAGSLVIMNSTLDFLLRTYLISTPLILILAGVGGLALMKRPLAPLLSLTAKADSIGRNGLGERLPVKETGDELQSLAVSLNRMIARLEEALAHNRRFSADASHELRTPLSILRGEMEEMLRYPDLPERAVGNTISAIEEIERMSHIVQSLMDITRLDAGGERLHLQQVNLTAVAQTTVDQMRLLADASEIPLTLEAPEELMILADPFRVKQVLVNLIDNAIKYTPEAGESQEKRSVAVRVLPQGDSVFVEVEDHGIGIPAPALPHVFDRFYRAEESRNRRAGGSGLGLAIVKAIVAAHQGTVSVHSIEGEGSVLRVLLPLRVGDTSVADNLWDHASRVSGD
jgi:signal transduction histidine kinase